MMPDAPAQPNGPMQNRMMAPQGSMPPPQGAPMGGLPPGAMMPPQNAMQAPQPAPAPAPTPEQIAEGRQHLNAVRESLTALAARPIGHLTKKDVFDEAATMLSKGAFSTPEAKQSLIVQLAAMPDDEPDIRKTIGRMLLHVTGVTAQFHGQYGQEAS